MDALTRFACVHACACRLFAGDAGPCPGCALCPVSPRRREETCARSWKMRASSAAASKFVAATIAWMSPAAGFKAGHTRDARAIVIGVGMDRPWGTCWGFVGEGSG